MVDNLIRQQKDKLEAASDEARLRLREWDMPEALQVLPPPSPPSRPAAVQLKSCCLPTCPAPALSLPTIAAVAVTGHSRQNYSRQNAQQTKQPQTQLQLQQTNMLICLQWLQWCLQLLCLL